MLSLNFLQFFNIIQQLPQQVCATKQLSSTNLNIDILSHWTYIPDSKYMLYFFYCLFYIKVKQYFLSKLVIIKYNFLRVLLTYGSCILKSVFFFLSEGCRVLYCHWEWHLFAWTELLLTDVGFILCVKSFPLVSRISCCDACGRQNIRQLDLRTYMWLFLLVVVVVLVMRWINQIVLGGVVATSTS